jgi:hypothetical protein
MRTFAAMTDAPPAAAWALLAEPGRWHEWAPHIRGAWGLGAPEVRTGARGAVRLASAVPVPARVTSVDPGRAWTWRVGVVDMTHRVEARASGSLVAVDLRAPGPLEPALAAAYGPVITWTLRRLARRAATGSAAASRD